MSFILWILLSILIFSEAVHAWKIHGLSLPDSDSGVKSKVLSKGLLLGHLARQRTQGRQNPQSLQCCSARDRNNDLSNAKSSFTSFSHELQDSKILVERVPARLLLDYSNDWIPAQVHIDHGSAPPKSC
eukprot:1161616-Pelagomonas_calceolata.AAC.4